MDKQNQDSGVKLDLNRILTEVNKLKRKMSVLSGQGSSSDGSRVLVTPAPRRFLSAQTILHWKITNFLQHFHK